MVRQREPGPSTKEDLGVLNWHSLSLGTMPSHVAGTWPGWQWMFRGICDIVFVHCDLSRECNIENIYTQTPPPPLSLTVRSSRTTYVFGLSWRAWGFLTTLGGFIKRWLYWATCSSRYGRPSVLGTFLYIKEIVSRYFLPTSDIMVSNHLWSWKTQSGGNKSNVLLIDLSIYQIFISLFITLQFTMNNTKMWWHSALENSPP